MIIDGARIARDMIQRLKTAPRPKPFLAAVLVGENEASRAFLRQKERAAAELGIGFRLYQFGADIGSAALRREVARISKQKNVGGVVVQLPLPSHLNNQSILNGIDVGKDVDCLTSRRAGEFYYGHSPVLPPAVGALREILLRRFSGEDILRAKRVVVIGSGVLVGKPIGTWLMGKVAELAVFDANTANVAARLREFDIIVSGAGRAGLFSGRDAQKSALVVDFGYDGGRGDFDPIGAGENDIAYTPTPGGTGPVVVAALMENFYALR